MSTADGDSVSTAVAGDPRRLAFGDDVVAAVLAHMHGDHGDDSTLIVRAHGAPEAVLGRLDSFDAVESSWTAVDPDGREWTVVVRWPEPLTDRASVRRQIVALHDAAV